MEKAGKENVMYQIGIIDDVAGQRADIQVAVLDNITEGTPVAFKRV